MLCYAPINTLGRHNLSLRMTHEGITPWDKTVFPHLKEMDHTFEDSNVHNLDRVDWFEKGVKDAIYAKLEKTSLNRGGDLQNSLSLTYNAALASSHVH